MGKKDSVIVVLKLIDLGLNLVCNLLLLIKFNSNGLDLRIGSKLILLHQDLDRLNGTNRNINLLRGPIILNPNSLNHAIKLMKPHRYSLTI